MAVDGEFPTIYGGKRKGLKFTYMGRRYLVLPRWQGVGGSVDEKYPFLFESVKLATDYGTVIFVVGGDGAQGNAIGWLERACNAHTGHPQTILLRSSDAFRGACQRAVADGAPLEF